MHRKLPLAEAVVTVLHGPQRGENNRCKITNLTNIAHLQYWETLKMRSQRTEKRTSDALALMSKLAGRDPEMLDLVEQEEANLDIARKIFELRTKAGLSQSELAKRVGTTQSVISRLEDADYDGHSLLMLRRIASALEKRLEIRFVSHHKLQPA
jgi:ribosome-binding protein aMBF1 (putative translation factor)